LPWPIGEKAAKLNLTSLESFRASIENVGLADARVAGVITSCERRTSVTGRTFALIGLTDRTGEFELIAFPDALSRIGKLDVGGCVIVQAEGKSKLLDCMPAKYAVLMRAKTIESFDDVCAIIDRGEEDWMHEYLRHPESEWATA